MPEGLSSRSSRIVAIEALKAACEAYPSQRVAQVLVNALGYDPFYVEDDVAAERLHEYAQKGYTE